MISFQMCFKKADGWASVFRHAASEMASGIVQDDWRIDINALKRFKEYENT